MPFCYFNIFRSNKMIEMSQKRRKNSKYVQKLSINGIVIYGKYFSCCRFGAQQFALHKNKTKKNLQCAKMSVFRCFFDVAVKTNNISNLAIHHVSHVIRHNDFCCLLFFRSIRFSILYRPV